MSFPEKSFWMLGDAGHLTDGDYDHSSKVEQKRGYQWLMDSAGLELFSNKKQVIEPGANRSGSGGVMDVPIWNKATSFPPTSGPLSNHLLGSETAGDIDGIGRNVMETHNFMQQYDLNSLMGLPVSQATGDPAEVASFGGIRKVKVSQVKDTKNDGPLVSEKFYNSDTPATAYNNDLSSFGSTYTNVNDNAIPVGSSYGKQDGSFISMGHYTDDEKILSFMALTPSYRRGENNSYDSEQNFISMASVYDKANNNFVTNVPLYASAQENIMSIGSTLRDASGLAIGQNYCRSDINMICFNGITVDPEKNPSASIISGHDSLEKDQMLNNASVATTHVDIVQPDAPSVVEDGQTAAPKNSAAKTKEPKGAKKVTSNNFPSNVKSLLSTGMFDGVPVKYFSWSREKNLTARIKGTGYLCGCSECNFLKVVNAYEFERHANCKTKHPNNHIFFANGKTVYAVVQELKNTPQEILFESIQSVTGSPINQKNFRDWKESYQAATRELQRIYGKDDDPATS